MIWRICASFMDGVTERYPGRHFGWERVAGIFYECVIRREVFVAIRDSTKTSGIVKIMASIFNTCQLLYKHTPPNV